MAKDVEIVYRVKDEATGKLKAIKSESQGLKGALEGAGRVAGSILTVGLAAAAAGAGLLAGALAWSVKGAMEAQDISAQLGAVLKSTGGAAGITAEEIEAMALGLSKMTRFEDDAIIGAQTLLLGFKNIGKKVFPQATKATLNLATRLKIDLPSAAKLLGKALETPGEGLLRLKQAGVAFTDQETEMILKMAEAGDMAGSQAKILDTLELSIGGAAEAAGRTFAGRLDILKNSLGNIGETIGFSVLPMLEQLAGKLQGALDSPEVQAGIASITAWLSGSLPGIIDKGLGYLTNTILPALQSGLGWIIANKDSIILAFELIAGAVIAIKLGAFLTQINGLTVSLGLLSGAVALFKTGWDNDWMGMTTSLKRDGEDMKSVWKELQWWFLLIGEVWVHIVKPVLVDMCTMFGQNIRTAIADAITWFQQLPANIAAVGAAVTEKALGIGKAIVEGIEKGMNLWWTKLKDTILGWIDGLIQWLKDLLGIKSPSSVFAGMGAQMVAGLMSGWGHAFGAFADQVQGSYAGLPGMGGPTGSIGAQSSTVHNWNLNVNAVQSVGSIREDFYVMRAMAGA